MLLHAALRSPAGHLRKPRALPTKEARRAATGRCCGAWPTCSFFLELQLPLSLVLLLLLPVQLLLLLLLAMPGSAAVMLGVVLLMAMAPVWRAPGAAQWGRQQRQQQQARVLGSQACERPGSCQAAALSGGIVFHRMQLPAGVRG